MARASTETRADPSGAGIRRVRDSEAEARRRVAETRIDCERRAAEARDRARDIEARARRRIERVQRIGQVLLDRALERLQSESEGEVSSIDAPGAERQRRAARRLAVLLLEGTAEAGSTK